MVYQRLLAIDNIDNPEIDLKVAGLLRAQSYAAWLDTLRGKSVDTFSHLIQRRERESVLTGALNDN